MGAGAQRLVDACAHVIRVEGQSEAALDIETVRPLRGRIPASGCKPRRPCKRIPSRPAGPVMSKVSVPHKPGGHFPDEKTVQLPAELPYKSGGALPSGGGEIPSENVPDLRCDLPGCQGTVKLKRFKQAPSPRG